MIILLPEDIRPHVGSGVADKVIQDHIADVVARAKVVAPCIEDEAFPHGDAVKAILRTAIIRRVQYGDGEVTTEQVTNGPFAASQTVDTRRYDPGFLTHREERDLRAMCAEFNGLGRRRRAFTVLPGSGIVRR